jgi:hypothetical protein
MEIGLRSNELGGQELVGTAALASAAAIRLPAECLRFIGKSWRTAGLTLYLAAIGRVGWKPDDKGAPLPASSFGWG